MNASDNSNHAIKGSCLCGAVVYEIYPPFSKFAHCHCARCRKASGAAHATNIYLEPPQLKWLSGREDVARFELPTARSFARWFCLHCGSAVPRLSRSGRTVVVPAGSLDEDPREMPRARIFCESETSWACRGDDITRYAEYPDWW